MSELHFLVLDAYAREGRAALAGAGGTEAGQLYRDLLRRIVPGAKVDVAYPADPDGELPEGAALADYDGVCWTGSSLTIHDAGDVRVRRQVELARSIFEAGTPSFGSCWAAQLSVTAAGGRCAASPRGREFGIARRIELSPAGRAHPLFEGKGPVFDALASHADEVVELPAGATLLASNDHSRVQAIDIEHAGGSFWSVQYHPEYDLREVAALTRLRRDELVAQRTFVSGDAADAFVRDLEALEEDPSRTDLAARLGVEPALLDPDVRTREVRNWIERRVTSGPSGG